MKNIKEQLKEEWEWFASWWEYSGGESFSEALEVAFSIALLLGVATLVVFLVMA